MADTVAMLVEITTAVMALGEDSNALLETRAVLETLERPMPCAMKSPRGAPVLTLLLVDGVLESLGDVVVLFRTKECTMAT